jgi:ribonuclease Z
MRSLVILGTAALSPTVERNQNGYLLFWDHEALLFDPGEGTQRQLLKAGVSVGRITQICISHLHGDHCLGLPGILQRRSVDPQPKPLDVYFPRSGDARIRRLIDATEWDPGSLQVRLHPLDDGAAVTLDPHTTLQARRLDHTVDVLGWRVEECPSRHLVPGRLRELGIEGTQVGEVLRRRSIDVRGRHVELDELTELRPGRCVAVVMDTRPCPAATDLARGADVLLCEATYLERDTALAATSGHLTAADAARIAAAAGVDRLILTHFSSRYHDVQELEREAAAIFPNVLAATDLTTIDLRVRRASPQGV